MKYTTLKPVAFVGPDAAQTVQKLYALEQRFLPIEVPSNSKLSAVLDGLEPLGFLGAVISGNACLEAPSLVSRRDRNVDRDGAVDAVVAHGGSFGAHTLEDALIRTLEDQGFRGYGAHVVVVGSGSVAMAATQLARQGFKTVTIAATDRPAAEKLARALPAGVSSFTLTLEEPRLADVLERADLIVHCGPDARLNPALLQPYHTLLEAACETNLSVAIERAGGNVIPYSLVAAHKLSAQLEFVTAIKFDPALLL